ncbi:aromatic-ring hydroxylase C-terminal domain-containing protein [Streptomyces sp. IBSNAI001]|uniref:aromatic-ring hydroxylase C-terminal domain-containing protein n=1 Tax=Streptomyces sp. IBSNAI001 TaxID=3457499 RepID=UPI003FD6BBD4
MHPGPGGRRPAGLPRLPSRAHAPARSRAHLIRLRVKPSPVFKADPSPRIAPPAQRGRVGPPQGRHRVQVTGLHPQAGLLVRPDGVVAWADDRAPDPEAFERASARWFGAPRGEAPTLRGTRPSSRAG